MPLVLTGRVSRHDDDHDDKFVIVAPGAINDTVIIVRIKDVLPGGKIRLEFDAPAVARVLRWDLWREREDAKQLRWAGNEAANHPAVLQPAKAAEPTAAASPGAGAAQPAPVGERAAEAGFQPPRKLGPVYRGIDVTADPT